MAGATTLNILVQDSRTQAVLTDEAVKVIVQPASGISRLAPTRASADASENKLLQAAEVNLAIAGDWALHLAVQRNAEHADFSLPIHVVQAEPGIGNPWPYLALLVFSALLLVGYLSAIAEPVPQGSGTLPQKPPMPRPRRFILKLWGSMI